MQSQYRLPNKLGLLVKEVFPQSSAQISGLRPSDVIVRLNSTAMAGNLEQAVGLLRSFSVGQRVPLTIYRDGQKQSLMLPILPLIKESNKQFETIYSAVKFETNHLRVILTKPKGEGRFPALLLLQGDACRSVEFPYEKEGIYPLIDSLTRRGIATVRMERAGQGDSQGVPCGSSFRTDVGSYQACLNYLKQQAFIDSANVFLYGYDIGGIIAPMIARESPVRGIIVFGTHSRSRYEYDLANLRVMNELGSVAWRWLAKQGPMPYDSVETITQTYAAALHSFLVKKQTPQQVIEEYPEVKTYFSYFLKNYPYYHELSAVNIARQWQLAKTNVLALRGAADYLTFVEDHQLITRIVNGQGANQAAYREVPQTDHDLNRVDTYQQSVVARKMGSKDKNYGIVDMIYAWINERVDDRLSRKN